MARLLTIPSECRLRIYDWYLQGISARLSVNSREMDGLPDKQCQYSVSFDFQEDKPAVIVNQHLDLLGVCRQIRNELLPFLATSLQVTVGRSAYPSNEPLPRD